MTTKELVWPHVNDFVGKRAAVKSTFLKTCKMECLNSDEMCKEFAC